MGRARASTPRPPCSSGSPTTSPRGSRRRKLIVTVAASGTVSVTTASAAASGASEAKKPKGLLRPSQGSGGPGQIKVKLKLTKRAASKLATKGKLKFQAAITFSPDAGIPRTETLKLKLKLKLKRH